MWRAANAEKLIRKLLFREKADSASYIQWLKKKGVTIGDNVVIGAGSVVTKDCESDSVYAGNPAKKIMTISEYLHKREALQFEEARNLARVYREKNGEYPPREAFMEYFMLFCTLEEAQDNPVFRAQMSTGKNYADSKSYMQTHAPMFESYEMFLNACYAE